MEATAITPRREPVTSWLGTPKRLAAAVGLWAAWYAAYRLYYGFGGHVGMIGQPVSPEEFRRLNLIGAAIILLVAILPTVAVRTSLHLRMPQLVARVGWVAGVAFIAHALTMLPIRVFSLTGVHPMHYQSGVWLSIKRQDADLQDLFFNEPWFFIEGCLWLVFATATLTPAARQRFLRAAAFVTVLAVAGGVLAGVGAVPQLIVA